MEKGLHMEKTRRNVFKIICITVTIAAVLLVLFLSSDRLVNRLRGTVFVTVNGEGYQVERVHCRYEDRRWEEVTYYTMTQDFGTAFKNRGNCYGMYEYSFPINHEEIDIEPRIRLFKTNWYRANVIDIDIKVYEADGVWNADVSVTTNLRTFRESFSDIENHAIEMRVE